MSEPVDEMRKRLAEKDAEIARLKADVESWKGAHSTAAFDRDYFESRYRDEYDIVKCIWEILGYDEYNSKDTPKKSIYELVQDKDAEIERLNALINRDAYQDGVAAGFAACERLKDAERADLSDEVSLTPSDWDDLIKKEAEFDQHLRETIAEKDEEIARLSDEVIRIRTRNALLEQLLGEGQHHHYFRDDASPSWRHDVEKALVIHDAIKGQYTANS